MALTSAERSRSMVASSREAPCDARGVTLMATGALHCHALGWRRAGRKRRGHTVNTAGVSSHRLMGSGVGFTADHHAEGVPAEHGLDGVAGRYDGPAGELAPHECRRCQLNRKVRLR